jgi:transposase-like protein
MDPTQVFCPNETCPARGQGGKGNITVHSRKEARYRCTVCEKTFSARRGTMFYWKKTPVDSIVLVVTLLAHGCPVRAIVAAFGLKAETVRTWAAEAGVHGEQVHRHLVLGACWSLLHGHADEMRVRMQKGMVWMAMALMVSTRLWLGGVVSAHRDKGLIRQLADRVRACARPGALLVAVDGLAASVNAFRCALRSKAPRKGPGRPHLAPWEQVVIGQVVKQDERGRMVGGVRRLVPGAAAALDALLAASGGGQTLHTASIERLNATFRSRLASLVRRTRYGARRQRMVTLGMYLVGTVDNFGTPHDTLTNAQGHRCTPAMAAGLTHHVWTVAELLHVHVPPPRWQPPKKRGRRSKELQTLIEQWAS